MWRNGTRQNKTPVKRNSQIKRGRQKKTVGERWTQTEFMYFIMPSARLWSMSHYHFNADCLLRLFGLSPHPLPPSISPSLPSSLPLPHGFPSFLLCWHNPSSCGAMAARLQVTLKKLRSSVKSSSLARTDASVCVSACLCVPTTFNVMLIQFIFNEETVSAYREAKEISGLLHSGKSIAHLFILLFELCV